MQTTNAAMTAAEKRFGPLKAKGEYKIEVRDSSIMLANGKFEDSWCADLMFVPEDGDSVRVGHTRHLAKVYDDHRGTRTRTSLLRKLGAYRGHYARTGSRFEVEAFAKRKAAETRH